MEPVRLGVIGCGVMGNVHLGNAAQLESIEAVAIADLREEAVRQASADHGAERTYASGLELLEDADVEAVVLAMPACHRTELALAAFAKGKHVLTEKPVALNAAEVEQMIAAKGELVAACCSSRYGFPPSARAARDFFATGALGDVRVAHCRAIRSVAADNGKPRPPWRLSHALNGGGILVNWGCYDLDYLLAITGWSLRPTVALAGAWQVAPHLSYHAAEGSDAETHICALIRCDSGAVISYERAEAAAADAEEAWRIVGTKGSLRLQMPLSEDKKIVFDTATAEDGLTSKTIWEDEESRDAFGLGLLDDFAVAIREGREPATGLEHALLMQKITDAVYESDRTGRAVDIG